MMFIIFHFFGNTLIFTFCSLIIEFRFLLYNYVITFIIYIGNIIEYLVSPTKKYAKIRHMLDVLYIYDEEANYYNVNYTNCKIEFDTEK